MGCSHLTFLFFTLTPWFTRKLHCKGMATMRKTPGLSILGNTFTFSTHLISSSVLSLMFCSTFNIPVLFYYRYLTLARHLQMTYKMEPAGSQGVWSLDDYQFIPFIWGSSQLQMHPKIAPEMFVNEKIAEENAEEYMFLSCIKFILSVSRY